MKLKLIVVLATAVLSVAAQAGVGQSVVLRDGSTAKVISENGTITSYVKGVSVSVDGKQTIEPGEVFVGDRIVLTPQGKCLQTNFKLIEMKEVSSGNAKIQLPSVKEDTREVRCTST